ncbi:MAG: Trk family potassium uptake protein [Tepidanaerobacter sp.]|nr:Trk family potassium uptake protein [Tepidanaerobacter sp.]
MLHEGLKRLKPTQILAVGFASLIIVGAFLLSLPAAAKSGESIGLLNALFTATSAVCVTGLTVIDTNAFSLFGQIVILILIQIGGLGIMTMATFIFLLLGKKITLRDRLVMQEALNQLTLSGLVKLTRQILLLAFVLEGLGALLFIYRFTKYFDFGQSLYYGLFHGVSSFTNSGFDVVGFGSLAPFIEDPIINIVTMFLNECGGLGFTVIYDIVSTRNFKRLSLHSKVVLTMTLILMLLGCIMFYTLEWNNPSTLGRLTPSGKMLAAAFHSVSTRTSGFNTFSLEDLTTPAKYLSIFLMFIGSSPASTGGGIKTSTFALIIVTIYTVMVSKEDVEIFNRRISTDNIFKAVVIAIVSALLIFVSSFILTITEQADFLPIFFEATGAYSTVGLSLGITQRLTDYGKYIIILTMFTGRLGPLTLAMALGSQRKKALRKFPEGRILIG